MGNKFGLFLIFFMMNLSISYAEKNLFYDSINNREIVDISGKKTVDDIKKEYNIADVQQIKVKDNEGIKIVNNQAVKYDIDKETKDFKDQRDVARKQKEDIVKQKLNLSDQDFQDLKDALTK